MTAKERETGEQRRLSEGEGDRRRQDVTQGKEWGRAEFREREGGREMS